MGVTEMVRTPYAPSNTANDKQATKQATKQALKKVLFPGFMLFASLSGKPAGSK